VEIKVTDVGNSAAAIDSYTSKEESAPVIGPGEQPSLPDWKALAASLAKSEYQETNIAGHDSNASPIRDLPQSGGVLIGFECIIGPFKDSQETVRGVKPIFLTEGGQKEGTIWGSKKSASVLRVIAKPGFAVGRVTGQYDGVAIRRMKVRFDRLFGMKLNSADSYETDWIGSYENQTEASADTNGRLAIGLAGMCGLGVDGIRLICLKP
jgi:hypothetical protein